MIKIIFGWYNPSNPLFGWHNRVSANDISSSFLPIYLTELEKCAKLGKNYDLYVQKDKKMIKAIKQIIDKNPELEKLINLYYDNGNKFWLIDWDNINAMFKQAKEDEKLELI